MQIHIGLPQIILELGGRSNQEDSVFPRVGKATRLDNLFILCDGMGGHENGEIASHLVCEVLSDSIHKNWMEDGFSDEILQLALKDVASRINEYDNDSFRKMGTTMTLLCIHRNGATMAHIGDSRIYHIRPSEHRILYKSRDHSVAYDLFIAGEIDKSELATYRRNLITRAIMPGQEGKFKVDITHTSDIKVGDYFLLCSDGLLENMDDADIVDILSSAMTDEEKREHLVTITDNNSDNHSAILVRIESVIKEGTDVLAPNDEQSSNYNALIWENRFPDNHPSNPSISNNPVKQQRPLPTSRKRIVSLRNVSLLIILIITITTILFHIFYGK